MLASLRVGRSALCAVADRNSLYAIGGESNNERLDVVESYETAWKLKFDSILFWIRVWAWFSVEHA